MHNGDIKEEFNCPIDKGRVRLMALHLVGEAREVVVVVLVLVQTKTTARPVY